MPTIVECSLRTLATANSSVNSSRARYQRLSKMLLVHKLFIEFVLLVIRFSKLLEDIDVSNSGYKNLMNHLEATHPSFKDEYLIKTKVGKLNFQSVNKKV